MDVWKKIQLSPFVPPIWTLVGSVPGVAGPPGPAGPRGSSGLSSSIGLISIVTGITDGSSASVGIVGETVSASLASGSAVSLVADTAKTVTSISLTAGRWMVYGLVGYFGAATTVISYCQSGTSTTNNTLPAEQFRSLIYNQSTNTSPQMPCPPQFINVNGTTIVYLIARAGFTTSTCGGYGGILAIRI